MTKKHDKKLSFTKKKLNRGGRGGPRGVWQQTTLFRIFFPATFPKTKFIAATFSFSEMVRRSSLATGF